MAPRQWYSPALALLAAGLTVAEPPSALPYTSYSDEALRFQPAMDFDQNGCYNTPAVDAVGNIATGLTADYWLQGDVEPGLYCHDESDLDNNNVYFRHKESNGIHVWLYAYYFEKDVGNLLLPGSGHRHDWEHIAVWVTGDEVQYVSVSQHGGYDIRGFNDVRFDKEGPKVVYHKDGSSTHCFRFANEDDDQVENDKGEWFRGGLVDWDELSTTLQDALTNADFGEARLDLLDENFDAALRTAQPEGLPYFDVEIGTYV